MKRTEVFHSSAWHKDRGSMQVIKKYVSFMSGLLAVYMILTGVFFQSVLAEEKFAENDLPDLQMKEIEEIMEDAKEALKKTVRITLCDPADGMYDPPFALPLSEEETMELVSMAEDMAFHSGNLKMIRWYRLSMIDDSGTVVDEWIVDGAHNVIDQNGLLLENSTALAEWFERMEKAHNVNYSLLSRAPGYAYFSIMPLLKKGHLSENRIDASEEGVEYDLTDEELSVLTAVSSTILTKADRNEDIDVYYILNIYDENGAELYSFSADHDGKYYCNRYPVYGEEIEAFFRSLEEENGL